MTSWTGRQFGKYVIHEEVGRGGMARVFRATDTILQRSVALKVLAPALAADQESSKRFEHEAITAANLRHPNIVTIFDVGEADGIPYIAMEYIAGRTLQAVIDERSQVGLGYTVAILLPVADALDYAHEHDSVHRDVKPQNIMVNADGRVVLMDFGIAQAPLVNAQRLTRTGVFMGTPEYISPEQAGAGTVDGGSDLYSLGVVAFEMITGQVPFKGSVPELLVAHTYHQAPTVSSQVAGLPATLDTIFQRTLAKQPAKRPPSARAFVDAMRMVAERSGIAIPGLAALAALSIPQGSSAGKSTMMIPAEGLALLPLAGSSSSEATGVGAYVPPVPVKTPTPVPIQRPQAAATRRATPAVRPQVRRVVRRQRSLARWLQPQMLLPVMVFLLLGLLGLVFWQQNQTTIPPLVTQVPQQSDDGSLNGPFVAIPTNTPIATRIATFEIPTATPEVVQTSTITVESTDLPTVAPTSIPPTRVPPTSIPPTRVPPTSIPPTRVPPTSIPPTRVPPTSIPPTPLPPTPVPPTQVQPTQVPTNTPLPTITPEPPLPPTEVVAPTEPAVTTETLPNTPIIPFPTQDIGLPTITPQS